MHAGENHVCGLVYVREKGELHHVNVAVSDVGHQYTRYKGHGLFGKDFSVQLSIDSLPQSKREDHFVFTYTKEGSLRYTVKSLFDIALSYIAENVRYVDSLVGFPEQMAGRLFAAVEEKHKFLDPVTAPKALQLFSEAYGELVLKSLCLRNRCQLLSERLEEITAFQGLQCLDLYGCRLGDNHDIFKHITSEALSSLIQLSLGATCLPDSGLQRLTAPVRVMRRGLPNLQLLDLSYNPITKKAFGYLSCFSKLQGLDVSETNVKSDMALNDLLWKLLGMVPSETPLMAFRHCCCKTEGWAEQVISQWEKRGSETLKRVPKQRTNALRFYGRERFVREALNGTPVSDQSDQSEDKILRIQFQRPDPSVNINLTEHGTNSQTKMTLQHGKKRQLAVDQDKHTDNPPAKRRSIIALSAEDIELLNNY